MIRDGFLFSGARISDVKEVLDNRMAQPSSRSSSGHESEEASQLFPAVRQVFRPSRSTSVLGKAENRWWAMSRGPIFPLRVGLT